MRRADEGSDVILSGKGSTPPSEDAGTAAVGEYTGLAKLKAFVSISPEIYV